MKLCFATNNTHKIDEIRQVLGERVELLSLADIGCTDELPENQDTLEGNATEKARYVWDHYRVNCFADDTGLEVAALNGEPGVYSARYAGTQRSSQDNMDLLLRKLAGKPNRAARFRTCICLIADGEAHVFEGIVDGRIIDAPRGTQGFGYDPVFVPEGFERTFAEMDIAEKGLISHRARATEKLVAYVQEHL